MAVRPFSIRVICLISHLSLLLKSLEVDVDEVFFFEKHVPYGHKYLTGDCHLDFYLALVFLGDLYVAEV